MSLNAAAALLVLSLLSTYVAYFWYGQSLRHLSPVQAAIIGNLEPGHRVLCIDRMTFDGDEIVPVVMT